jgi:hypothetical protein
MAKRTITSANSSFMLVVPDVFPVPQQIQGYAVDDAFDTENVEIAQTQMGVDGLMSGGFTPYITPLTVHLMADSPSILVFEAWGGAMKAAREVFYGSAIIAMPSIGKNYTLVNGVMVNFKPLPDAKKVLQAVHYTLHFEESDPATF